MQDAAQKLGQTQAAVSQQLKNLELEMGRELFQFQGKKKVANVLGQKAFEALRGELKRLESVWNELKEDQLLPSQLTLTVVGRKEIVEAVTDRIHFDGKIKFISSPSQEAYETMLERKADLAILNFKSKHTRVVQKKLVTVSCRWFNPTKISLSDLQSSKIYQIPLIAYSDKLPFLEDWCSYYKQDVKRLHIRAVIDNWFMVKSLCIKHQALAITPDNIESYSEFDSYPVGSTIIKPIEFYYAYLEDSKPLLKKGNFSCN